MPTRSTRIPDRTRADTCTHSRRSCGSERDAPTKTIKVERRNRLLGETNAAYAKLRRNKRVWAYMKHEYLAWDATLADGFEKRLTG
jgi:hypothetical protein